MERYGFISLDVFPLVCKIRKPPAAGPLLFGILIHAGPDGLVDHEILALAADCTAGKVHRKNFQACLEALVAAGLMLEELPGTYRLLCPHKAGGWQETAHDQTLRDGRL